MRKKRSNSVANKNVLKSRCNTRKVTKKASKTIREELLNLELISKSLNDGLQKSNAARRALSSKLIAKHQDVIDHIKFLHSVIYNMFVVVDACVKDPAARSELINARAQLKSRLGVLVDQGGALPVDAAAAKIL